MIDDSFTLWGADLTAAVLRRFNGGLTAVLRRVLRRFPTRLPKPAVRRFIPGQRSFKRRGGNDGHRRRLDAVVCYPMLPSD